MFYLERTGTNYENQSATVLIITNHGRGFFPLTTTASGFGIAALPLVEISPKRKKSSGTQGTYYPGCQKIFFFPKVRENTLRSQQSENGKKRAKISD